jgi:methylmalonyl-CoA/ethylmalonyl-CoA epimerase
MISRIDHISIAVKDYPKALYFFKDILGAVSGAGARNNDMKYHWQIFSFGDLSRLEIITPLEEKTFLTTFLNKNKNGGLHHISLQTPDIQNAIKKLEAHDIPYFGYNEYNNFWKEIFIHPNYAFGVLIQIAEFNPDDWLDPSLVFPNGQKWEVIKNNEGCTLNLAHPGGGKVKLKLNRSEIQNLISDLEKF